MSPRTGALLATLVALSACAEPLFQDAPPTLELRVASGELWADGRDTTTVILEIGEVALPPGASVRVSATRGRVSLAGSPPADSLIVRPAGADSVVLRLTAGREVGTGFLAASFGSVTGTRAMSFRQASPDSIGLFADRAAAVADGATPATVTAVLKRDTGSVSIGVEVTFTVVDVATGLEERSLRHVVRADSAGRAVARLISAAAVTYDVTAAAGDVVSESLRISFTGSGQ